MTTSEGALLPPTARHRRRRWWVVGLLVAVVAAGGATVAASWRGEATAQEKTPVTTSPAGYRDIAQTLRLVGTVQPVNRTIVGEPSLRVQVALPIESLFELVPAMTDGRATVTVAIQGRKAASCAEVRVQGVVPVTGEDLLTREGDLGSGGPELVCTLSNTVVAYLSESATIRVKYVTSTGRREVVEAAGVVSEHRQPDVTERDHDEIVADVDPSLLHLALPAVQTGTATGQAIISSEGRTFSCASMALLEATVEAPDKHRLSCLIPGDEKVYAGSAVTLIVTVDHVEDALSIPTAAVRTSVGGQGIVTVVVTGAEGATSLQDRTVELGVSDGLSVQIRSGLEADERVLDPAVQE